MKKEMAMCKLLLVALTGMAAFALTSNALFAARNRRRSAHAQVKDQVQTWENEGGHVPDVATVHSTPATDGARH